MATKLPPVDVVIVGLGWTGGILAKELAQTGLKIVALERGGPRSTQNDFAIPLIRDEIRYSQRHDMMMDVAVDTYTIRNKPSETPLPMRRLGSFLPGEGVGGAGVHWNGLTWRWPDHEFRIRTKYEERYGKSYIPGDMPLQDWGITGPEIEPYYDKFEYTAGVSGKAGNIKGVVQKEGNPFEDPRSRDYPLPPLESNLASKMFHKATAELGYHPFSRPVADASRPYTNPDGMKLGQCEYCGFCERFGCEFECKRESACHRDPGGAAQFQRGTAHPRLGHQGDQGLDWQEGDRRRLRQHAHWRRNRAARRSGGAVRLHPVERPHDAAVRYRQAVRSGDANRRHRQELLLPSRRKPHGVLRRQELQPVHRDRRLGHIDRRLPHQLGLRPEQTRRHRRLLYRRRWLKRPSDRLSAGAKRHPAMGLGVEARDREMVPQRIHNQRVSVRDAKSS